MRPQEGSGKRPREEWKEAESGKRPRENWKEADRGVERG